VDPLGKAFGDDCTSFATRRQHEVWLDLRTAENTFAQMVITKLFYGVRRVVDEAGRGLPSDAKIQGLLFSEERYDRADTLGQNIPIYVETQEGMVNATTLKQWDPLDVDLRSPSSQNELMEAQAELMGGISIAEEGSPKLSAIALPAGDGITRDSAGQANFMWAMALTGLSTEELEMKEANIGA
jgi:hypothetical protein